MFGSSSGGGGGGGGGRDDNESLTRLTQMMMMSVPPPQPAAVVGDADDFSRREVDRVPLWSQQETRDFIAIRGELERDFTTAKRNKSLWEVVAGKMKEIGYKRTPDQCKCKWKNLVNRYKGKETSDRENTRSFPFFNEMHALFTERTNNTPQTPFEPEATSSHSKKRLAQTDSYQSLEEISEDEDEYEDDEIKITKAAIPPRKKPEREKRARTSSLDKPPTPKQPSSGNNSIREILHDFFQQQEMIDMQWRRLMEKHDYERRVFDQEWRQSMERLEMERMRIEQSWREKEEQRRMREESRAERRDALLTALLNKLVHEQ
ncbi:hypothetical protein L6452_32084 [Arctium lappa]|uniref:Uncharacterized protein n=1 Tax=Arctium lappa TaxID=4217 RepID=A0ACB8Z3H9_ARCLA|nr:hypothetical protein L6452_32084 [Arctium lappa]